MRIRIFVTEKSNASGSASILIAASMLPALSCARGVLSIPISCKRTTLELFDNVPDRARSIPALGVAYDKRETNRRIT